MVPFTESGPVKSPGGRETPPAFAGQHVVVTGAGRGIGRGCALGFAEAGATVHLLSRTPSELEEVVRGLEARGHRAIAHVCDVTVSRQVSEVFDRLPRCDVLVNNAGGNKPEPFIDVEPATLDHYVDLNIKSVFRVSQAAVRLMQRQEGGVIVNMSSQMGHVGAVDRTVYCMTKHAVEGLTKAMAVELAGHNIRVVSVCPTFVETPMSAAFFEDPSFRQRVLDQIPLGRIGTIEEVVAAVLFLASGQASLITGTGLLVDGGWTAK